MVVKKVKKYNQLCGYVVRITEMTQAQSIV